MQDIDLLHRLGVALAIGLLVGAERHWRERDEPSGQRTAGVRTFALIGLFGGTAGAIGLTFGAGTAASGLFLGLCLLGLSAAIIIFKQREAEAEGDFSVTSVVVAQLTFALGALAVVGEMTVAGAAAVALTGLLASRELLHGFLAKMTWAELRSAILLLAMSFVALPLVPDESIEALGGLNPRRVWLLAIILAAVSYIGYIAVRLFGAARGRLAAGAAGGLVSSTAVAVSHARESAVVSEAAAPLAAGALVAGAISYLRTAALVWTVAADVGLLLLPALLAGAAVQGGAAALLALRGSTVGEAGTSTANPFELMAVLKIAALLAAVGVIGDLAAKTFGEAGVFAVTAISGLADVDAVSLAMSSLVPHTLTAPVAAAAIAVAVASNTAAKSVYGVALGSRRFALLFGGASLLALAVGGLVLAATSAS